MDIKEQEKIINAIQNADVSDETKRAICGIVRLAGYDIKRLIAVLSENCDTDLARSEIESELDHTPEEMVPEYIEFLLDEIDFCDKISEELRK